MFCFVLALLFLLYHVQDSDADGKVDGGEVLLFLRCGDFAVVGALSVAQAGCLVGAVYQTIIMIRERGGQLCWDTVLERKGPGSMALSGVALLYDGFVASLDGGQLARVVLLLLCLEQGIPQSCSMERWLVRRIDDLLGRVRWVLGWALSFVLPW